jgi:metallophosphoesterase (TIGR03768 family)
VACALLVSQALVAAFSATPKEAWYPNPYGINTTLVAQVVPVPPPSSDKVTPPEPNDLASYSTKGYGNWELQQSNGYTKRTELLPKNTKDATKSTQLTQFFTMSDIHIVDMQSATQPLYFGEKPNPGMQSAYTGSMLYSTQTFNTAIKSVNQLHAESKIDFGLFLGDAINNAQKNELDMYLDIIEGRMVSPNSNPSMNYTTEYMQPFKAEGLNVPWYQVLGNHDHFWEGSQAITDKVQKFAVGDTIMKQGLAQDSQSTEGNAVYGGIIDPSTVYGKIVMSGFPVPGDEMTHKITPNVERKPITNIDFINMIPNGHGLKLDTSKDPLGCYTVEPKSNVPVMVIVIDDTAPQDEKFTDLSENTKATNAALSYFSNEKLTWLKKQMKKAQDENKLIVVATHIPLGIEQMWSSSSEVKRQDFINTLNSYPNMTLLLAGHRHLNTVKMFQNADQTDGFWQVETASLRDFPQQFKMLKINVNNNGTISVFANSVDPIIEPGSMMEKARIYAIGASQIYPEPRGMDIPKEKSRVENVELFKKLTPKMEAALKQYIQ